MIVAVLLSSLAFSQDIEKGTATKVVSAYLVLKDALVDSDVSAASIAAVNLNQSIESSQDELLKNILVESKKIAASTDVKTQRAAFSNLSDFVYELAVSTEASEALASTSRRFAPAKKRSPRADRPLVLSRSCEAPTRSRGRLSPAGRHAGRPRW